MQPKIVFVLGGPGAGKGTQCQRIVQNFGYVHLSAGDLLREERNKPASEYGELIENYIREERCLSRGASGSGRSDDNLDSLNKRLNTYLNETKPIIDYYENLNLVRRIDATRLVDEVYEDVKKVFQEVNDTARGDN
ncbi:hypothetical protein NQ317_010062 [Molorchus minor]|uniref:Adenylate kinase n=1 Tax=Molorchus minor TaxID=1323400 RepID=A0ABQ9JK69_9CUCU|nr:hypothetical protein NQ317_010062 [Molorchus minor]